MTVASTILVCGATGRQGGAVARRLLKDGWQVRALTRNPGGAGASALRQVGAEVVQGDLTQPRLLESALSGVTGVYGVTDFWEHGFAGELRQGRNLIEACKRAGVKHVVFGSVGGTERTERLGIAHFDAKREIERHLQDAPLTWTILRPVTFFENFLSARYRRAIVQKQVLYFGIEPDKPFQMIAMQDLAHFAAMAFSGDRRLGGTALEIASDGFTLRELARALSSKLQRTVRYRFLPPWKQKLIACGVELAGRRAHYKVGCSLVTQFRWNNASATGGWAADLAYLRQLHPDLTTLQRWVDSVDWLGNRERVDNPSK